MVPKYMFLTKGVGCHREKLSSFELALREAGIEKCNLVTVSSIYPPQCEIIEREEGLKMLKPGEIVFCVMARNDTNEPDRLTSASIGLAVPKDKKQYGYLSEHHAFGENDQVTGDYAEDLAAAMLASTLGVDFDPNEAWDERKKLYISSGKIIQTTHIAQTARGHKDGLWTTVMAAAIFIL
ncbi:MAG: arginine decarboxylase, pyruvoyl-dependent [Candidatus Auribacterota bacterium]|nr:arginine decarboxylase, pyruvoyl-dependent [Candidatus Auribacterota bacterium]